MKGTVIGAITSGVVVLVLVIGALALDKTVLHWYVDEAEVAAPIPTATREGPIHTAPEVEDAVNTALGAGWCDREPDISPQVAVFTTKQPAAWNSVRARWVVTCEITSMRPAEGPVAGSVICIRVDDQTLESVRRVYSWVAPEEPRAC